jgi:transcriptional regulator with XRE-family HTH domain
MCEREWLDTFADNLVDYLRDAKMTQKELAEAADISESSVSSYIRRQKMPTIKAIINMAYVLDVDISDFIDFGDMIL